MNYDVQFRTFAASDPALHWNARYTDLWFTIGRHNTLTCGLQFVSNFVHLQPPSITGDTFGNNPPSADNVLLAILSAITHPALTMSHLMPTTRFLPPLHGLVASLY